MPHVSMIAGADRTRGSAAMLRRLGGCSFSYVRPGRREQVGGVLRGDDDSNSTPRPRPTPRPTPRRTRRRRSRRRLRRASRRPADAAAEYAAADNPSAERRRRCCRRPTTRPRWQNITMLAGAPASAEDEAILRAPSRASWGWRSRTSETEVTSKAVVSSARRHHRHRNRHRRGLPGT